LLAPAYELETSGLKTAGITLVVVPGVPGKRGPALGSPGIVISILPIHAVDRLAGWSVEASTGPPETGSVDVTHFVEGLALAISAKSGKSLT
jgi:hypothetical protein